MKSLKELTAQLVRRQALAGQEGHGRTVQGDSRQSDMLRRFMRKKPKDEALDVGADLGPAADGTLVSPADLAHSLQRARVALLSKKPAESEHSSLAEMMGD